MKCCTPYRGAVVACLAFHLYFHFIFSHLLSNSQHCHAFSCVISDIGDPRPLTTQWSILKAIGILILCLAIITWEISIRIIALIIAFHELIFKCNSLAAGLDSWHYYILNFCPIFLTTIITISTTNPPIITCSVQKGVGIVILIWGLQGIWWFIITCKGILDEGNKSLSTTVVVLLLCYLKKCWQQEVERTRKRFVHCSAIRTRWGGWISKHGNFVLIQWWANNDVVWVVLGV